MKRLNGMDILLCMNDVDDGLVMESMELLAPLTAPLSGKAPRRGLLGLLGGSAWAAAAGIVAAVGLTVSLVLVGPQLSGWLSAFLGPDETETETTDTVGDPGDETSPGTEAETLEEEATTRAETETEEAPNETDTETETSPVIVTDVWDGSVASSFGGGMGRSDDPYRITTCAQLAYLGKLVNGGKNFANQYFLLEADLDLNGLPWTPIGFYGTPFRGILDGNGHRVKNLSVTAPKSADGYACAGLFGYLRDGILRGLWLEKPVVKLNMEYKPTYAYVGALCGLYEAPDGGAAPGLDSCLVTEGKITVQKGNTLSVGGIVGQVAAHDGCDLSLRMLESHCTLEISTTDKAHAGGIAGYFYCRESGRIQMDEFCGYTTASTIKEGTQYIGTVGAIAAPKGRITLNNGFGRVTVKGELLTSNTYKNDGYAIVGLIYDGSAEKSYYFTRLTGKLTASNKAFTELYFCYYPHETGIDHRTAVPDSRVMDARIWDLSDPQNPSLRLFDE